MLFSLKLVVFVRSFGARVARASFVPCKTTSLKAKLCIHGFSCHGFMMSELYMSIDKRLRKTRPPKYQQWDAV